MSNLRHLQERFNKAVSERKLWDVQYKTAKRMVCPENETYEEYFNGQDKSRGVEVFDSTAGLALEGGVSNLQMSLTPPNRKWIYLTPGFSFNKEEERYTKAAEALQSITNILFQGIRLSNFDNEIASAYADLLFGVGCIKVDRGSKQFPYRFSAVPIEQLYLEQGPFGRPDGIFRKPKEMTAAQIEATWPEGTLPEPVSEEDSRDKKYQLIEAVVPEKIIIETKSGSKKVDGYRYSVWQQGTEHLIFSETYRSNPFVVFRWFTLPGEVFARGPVLRSLPDIFTINDVKRSMLMQASRDLGGIYTTADNQTINIDNIRFRTITFIPVESNGGSRGPSIAPLPSSGRVDLSQFVFNDIQAGINKMMMADALGRVDLPVKTATEIAARQADLARRIGPAFSRIQYELITPLINRCLDVLDELDLIDLDEYRIDGETIDIQYLSPLAVSQAMDEVQNIIGFQGTMMQMFGEQIGPGFVDPEKAAKYLRERFNVPLEVMYTQAEIEQMKQAVVEQASQQAQMQQMQIQQAQPMVEEVPMEMVA